MNYLLKEDEDMRDVNFCGILTELQVLSRVCLTSGLVIFVTERRESIHRVRGISLRRHNSCAPNTSRHHPSYANVGTPV
jgi:hypothetical protein